MSEEALRRLLQLLGHSHGQNWNHSEAARVLGVSYTTVRRHLENLLGAFMVRQLPPFFANVPDVFPEHDPRVHHLPWRKGLQPR
ncbi:MAG TPA: helix-turn-helix domain-containing protein [Verrucomicrobiota bacterium]|nr:helix-turn-helix domain-containing protein [Verrucomicrobiota bacterium]